MTETILVTSATSNVGTPLVKQLAEQGVNVRAAVRSIVKAQALKFPGVELVEMDLDKPETIPPAFAGVDKVFLTTPITENMVETEAMCLEAAKKAGVKHIVKLSIMGADFQPPISLGQLHKKGEENIAASGITYTFLRPNSFHQNYDTYVGQTIRTQNTFYLPLGEAKISFVDTRDIAAVAVATLTQTGHEGKVYQITGSEALSNDQVASILSAVLGRQINYVAVSVDATKQALLATGMPDARCDLVLGLYARQAQGDYSDISPVVEQVTGKKAIHFEQFAQDFAEVFKKE